MHGLNMQIERDGEIIATVPGLPNRETATNRQYVGFRPKTDIKIDDVIITPANERLYVTETQASFFQKQQEEIKAFYMTEVEKKRKETEQRQSNIYNIGSPCAEAITVRMSNGKNIEMTADHWSPENLYVKELYVNGKKYDKSYLTYDDIRDGVKLRFVMSSKPNYKRAVSDEAVAPSISSPGKTVKYSHVIGQ